MDCMPVFLPHLNPYTEMLTPKVMVPGGLGFGEGLGREGGALINGTSALMRSGQRACSPSPQSEETL